MHSERHAHRFPSVTESNCAAIVSAYRPSSALVHHVQGLLDQFSVVVIVDDGSADDGVVLQACADLGAMIVIQPENTGIGHALNRGVAAAREVRPDLSAVVTFDQDSMPPPNLLQSYAAAVDSAQEDGHRVGGVSPGVVAGRPVNRHDVGVPYVQVVEPIQSGLLVPLSLFDELEGFDGALFIDGVDTDFYWRAATGGYSVIAATDVSLGHELGTQIRARLFGRPVTVRGRPLTITQSAPFRYYYLARNRILLFRRYVAVRPLAMVRGVLQDLRHLCVVALLGSSKRDRLRYALRGARDGLHGVSGRLRDSPPSSAQDVSEKGSHDE